MSLLTAGTWRVGLTGCVVSDAPVHGRGMHDADRAYYGGELICESIATKADAQMLSAAKDGIAACRLWLAAFDAMAETMPEPVQMQIGTALSIVKAKEAALAAIAKAEGWL